MRDIIVFTLVVTLLVMTMIVNYHILGTKFEVAGMRFSTKLYGETLSSREINEKYEDSYWLVEWTLENPTASTIVALICIAIQIAIVEACKVR